MGGLMWAWCYIVFVLNFKAQPAAFTWLPNIAQVVNNVPVLIYTPGREYVHCKYMKKHRTFLDQHVLLGLRR